MAETIKNYQSGITIFMLLINFLILIWVAGVKMGRLEQKMTGIPDIERRSMENEKQIIYLKGEIKLLNALKNGGKN